MQSKVGEILLLHRSMSVYAFVIYISMLEHRFLERFFTNEYSATSSWKV